MTLLLAIAFLIGVGIILKKLVDNFGGEEAEPMSYWDSFAWILAPRILCRVIFYFFPGPSPTTQAITWVIAFMTIIPFMLHFAFNVRFLRAILITLGAMALLLLELALYLVR